VEAKVRFSRERSFQRDLQARVESRLAALGRPRHGGGRLYGKTALILFWAGISYAGLLAAAGPWRALPFAISLGLALAAIGFNVAHDGNHGAGSPSRRVNRLLGATLDLLGGSSYVWRWKHNVFHHSFPNVHGLDDDIDLGALCRMSRHQPLRAYHRWQHAYMWGLYGFIVPKWQLWDDFAAVARGRLGDHPFPRPRGLELALFAGGKLALLAWAFALPALLHGLPAALLAYAVVAAVEGFTLSIVFQLAHSNEETAAFSIDEAEDAGHEWAVHQVETTADFARESRLLTWYTGGLNHQIEHHLFPRVSHVHLPAVREAVEEVCREHGVRYRAHATLWTAIESHHAWMRSLGRGEAAAR
jgi:linoleoyl-CoA desaturase